MRMSHPELGSEQVRAENTMHLQTRISGTEDPNLSRVTAYELESSAVDAWGTFRRVCSLMDAHATDGQLSPEVAKEIKDVFSQLTSEVRGLSKNTESQKDFIAFMNNMLTMEQAVEMTLAFDPEEWSSLYQNLLLPIAQNFK